MPNAFVPLASFSLASAQALVTFAGIPATGYRDLCVIINYGLPASNSSIRTRFNGDTAANYSQQHMGVFGTSSLEANAGTDTSIVNAFRVGTTSTTVNQNQILHIFDYATSKQKSVLLRSNMNTEVEQIAGRWSGTAAITSISFVDYGGGNFTAGSTFNLYGVI